MFDLDFFHEIASTIKNNKLRTFLTGFAVAWGILLLMLLLAAGNGLKGGVMYNFAGRAMNAVTVWPGRTSMSHAGFSDGRVLKFTTKDVDLIKNEIPGLITYSPRLVEQASISYEDEFGVWYLDGTNENIAEINHLVILKGRFLNRLDVEEKRKVIVISEDIRKILFKKGQEPIGEFVIANDIMYEVIGVYDRINQFQSSFPAYIPISVSQMLYGQDRGIECNRIDFLIEGLETKEDNEAFAHFLREKFGTLHNFSSHDRSALFIRNTSQEAIQTRQVLELINIFIFIVGLFSLIAGIVGVSNIMIITVKERTKEIGIRKAIGARPVSVIFMIVLESVFITMASGYVGLLIGLGIIEVVSRNLINNDSGLSVFRDPSVDILTVVVATLIIVVCGVLAGFMPALRASKISPIEAMRDE